MRRATSTIARISLGLLGAVCLAIGSRVAYDSYRTEKILEICISGGSCPLNLNSLSLLSAYSSTRGQLLLGASLAVLGVVALMYSFLFMGGLSNPPIIAKQN
jgi:hypothetical protein